jgi:hypothetical protein
VNIEKARAEDINASFWSAVFVENRVSVIGVAFRTIFQLSHELLDTDVKKTSVAFIYGQQDP